MRHGFAQGVGLLIVLAACVSAAAGAETIARRTASAEGADGALRYLVIGSFARADNAERWARSYADFDASVQAAGSPQHRVYRVLVGPTAVTGADLMSDMLAALGVEHSWPLVLCPARSRTDAPCSGLTVAAN